MSEKIANPSTGNKIRNIVIAIAAIALSVAVFLGLQTDTNASTLEAQAKSSIALETAMNNGKPTLTEFYADWCTSCQAMSADLAEIKQDYGDRVNFVMLNVDNTKWLPEILRYQVDGIPHFVFMNRQGEAIAETIGEQPRSVLEADLDALIAENPLPHTYTSGRISQFKTLTPTNSQADPRSHGAQIN